MLCDDGICFDDFDEIEKAYYSTLAVFCISYGPSHSVDARPFYFSDNLKTSHSTYSSLSISKPQTQPDSIIETFLLVWIQFPSRDIYLWTEASGTMILQNLSNELLSEILLYLLSADRVNFSLCNKHLKGVAEPILYSSFTQTGSHALLSFLRTLLSNPFLSGYVKELSITCWDFETPALDLGADSSSSPKMGVLKELVTEEFFPREDPNYWLPHLFESTPNTWDAILILSDEDYDWGEYEEEDDQKIPFGSVVEFEKLKIMDVDICMLARIYSYPDILDIQLDELNIEERVIQGTETQTSIYNQEQVSLFVSALPPSLEHLTIRECLDSVWLCLDELFNNSVIPPKLKAIRLFFAINYLVGADDKTGLCYEKLALERGVNLTRYEKEEHPGQGEEEGL
ncbi:hypothetical protein G7Y89_g6630 [Cudoniella acicularis]|uniref:F-box domain-containing protein n=1 Tax=Cudoniella acicularis TaxID=354080 RepID=A0A8H4RK25_9HELO|nr:hypothetical protein G7Y89_g6630 [Cudoniella acicularis]